MVKHVIGYRFSPTGGELVNHYLKNKNLGNNCLVDEAISEINLLSYEPKFLPSLAKIQSDDLKWYFFSRIEYANTKKNAMKRTTGSGFWKPTGKDRIIRDKDGVEIGLKKTLVYHKREGRNGVRTDWVMHEYHITCLPHDQRTYVICQVMYKDKDGDIPSGGNYSSEPSQSLVSDSNTIRVTSIPPVFQVEQQPGQDNYYGLSENDLRTPLNEQKDLSECDGFDPNTFLSDNNNNVQLQTPYLPQEDDEFMCELPPVYRGTAQHLLSDQDSIMQEEYNDYMLMNTVTPTITTASEFEQPGPENLDGFSVDDLIMIPMNEQYDLCPWDVLDPNMSFRDNNSPTVQPQAPNEEFISRLTTSMTENRNDHRPKKPLSGIIVDYSSDSDIDSDSDSDIDAESISAMSYQGTSSPGDSVGSPNKLQDEQSLNDALAAYRTAAHAAARIQDAFREKALKAARSSVIQFANKEEEAKSIIAAMKIQNAFRKYDTRRKIEAAYQIQCRFQTWKMRKEYLNMRCQAISVGSQNILQDEQSLKDALAARRTAAEAAARIQGAFREKALKAARSSVIQFANKEEEAKSIIAAMKIQNAFRKYDTRRKIEAAYQIQCRFQTWKMRREYLSMRRQAIRIQAAFRGLQVRRQYKKIVWSVGVLEKAVLSWRQKRKGFRGLQVAAEEDSPDEAEEDFYKTSQRQAEERLERSVVRVQAVFRSKKAQEDYRRMKLTLEEAQLEYNCLEDL